MVKEGQTGDTKVNNAGIRHFTQEENRAKSFVNVNTQIDH